MYANHVYPSLKQLNSELNQLNRQYMAAQMAFEPNKNFYPDANFTLRVAYGNVQGYHAADAVTYNHLSTIEGIIEKEGGKTVDEALLATTTEDGDLLVPSDKLKSYGAGNDHNDQHWMAVIRQANVGGYLHKDIESYGNLSLTDKGKEFLKKPTAITFTKERDRVDEDAPDDEVVVNGKGGAADERLMKMLVDLRHNLAKKSKLAPYMIFQENALEEMTVRYPITVEELTQITGVGAGKAQKYGKPFVDLIATYVEENEIERPEEEAVVRSVVKKSSNKVHIIQNIDKRLALESIAKAKNLSMADLLEEMETIVSSGTRLDINYYLEEKLDEDALDEIMDYFRDADSDDLDEALKEFGGDFSEEELRLVRLKFMSEVAN